MGLSYPLANEKIKSNENAKPHLVTGLRSLAVTTKRICTHFTQRHSVWFCILSAPFTGRGHWARLPVAPRGSVTVTQSRAGGLSQRAWGLGAWGSPRETELTGRDRVLEQCLLADSPLVTLQAVFCLQGAHLILPLDCD